MKCRTRVILNGRRDGGGSDGGCAFNASANFAREGFRFGGPPFVLPECCEVAVQLGDLFFRAAQLLSDLQSEFEAHLEVGAGVAQYGMCKGAKVLGRIAILAIGALSWAGSKF